MSDALLVSLILRSKKLRPLVSFFKAWIDVLPVLFFKSDEKAMATKALNVAMSCSTCHKTTRKFRGVYCRKNTLFCNAYFLLFIDVLKIYCQDINNEKVSDTSTNLFFDEKA